MSLFIQWPWLALLPSALFWLLYWWSKRNLAAGMALAWALYAAYEYGMLRRWLCSGECNIRVDLLLLYPVLLLGSGIAAVVAIRATRRHRHD